ncbi:MAG: phage virion morphogenesis protein [Candidatus Cloacimonetes bacterium]|nr:phage virion morphogenesis protein [Candidatus Cloacimonadota bacterium]
MTPNIFDLYKSIAIRIVNSVKKNFIEGGRPEKWKPSKRAMQMIKGKTGKTLVDKGILRNSIKYNITNKTIKIGTNVFYARIHNEGGKHTFTQNVRSHLRTITKAWGKSISPKKIDVRSHQRTLTVDMPQRRFLLIQDDDKAFIKKKMIEYTKRFFGGINHE